MAPPHEGFGADDGSRARMDHGLVVHLELITVEGVAEFGSSSSRITVRSSMASS